LGKISNFWIGVAPGSSALGGETMLKIVMLPAGHGDCLWIEYGDPQVPRRILIDGGTKGTYQRALRPKLLGLPEDQRRFELLVVTHIDADHIAGILELLADEETGFQASDIWFNGFRHLPDESPETLGPVQGERLTDLLIKPGVCWNTEFNKAAVLVPPSGQLPRIDLEGGLALTLLSPTLEQLAKLKPKWEEEVRKAGLDPRTPRPEEVESPEGFELLAAGPPDVEALAREPFSEDTSEANGSSIALFAEYGGYRLLLSGDAHPSVLKAAINRIGTSGVMSVTACKLPHHGSKANVDREFLQALDCKAYLFSSNGAYFRHPDQAAVARVIKWGGVEPRLVFNYRSKYNSIWDSKPLRDQHGYTARFPDSGSGGVMLEWD
jgi:beta-lactamase superfamily II metal-dependent hydrolase